MLCGLREGDLLYVYRPPLELLACYGVWGCVMEFIFSSFVDIHNTCDDGFYMTVNSPY